MAFHHKENPVLDPGQYGSLISDQRKRCRRYPGNSIEWVKLGQLFEDRLEAFRGPAKRIPLVRFFFPAYLGLFLITVAIMPHLFFPYLFQLSTHYLFFLSIYAILMAFLLVRLWCLRYPPSGARYFRKAVRVDPYCSEAYIQLGLIALRRHQKQKACRLWEQAIRVGGANARIERELNSIYEKRLMAFFEEKSQQAITKEKVIASQREEIEALRNRIASLENLKGSLRQRTDQAKWEASRTAKILTRRMADRIAAIRKEHKAEIMAARASQDAAAEERELTQRKYMLLTTKRAEAKDETEGWSLDEASRSVRNRIGSDRWSLLLEQTRRYLTTAEHTLSLLTRNQDDPDYSLVGMELCKALETEINRSLVTPFIQYLDGNKEAFLIVNQIGEVKGKPLYFTYLARVVDRKNFPEVTSLTLGQYHFALKRALGRDYALREYSDFLDQIAYSSKIVIGRSFLHKLETVAKKYRNAIAHSSPMSRRECHHLRRLVFAGKDPLIGTCLQIVREMSQESLQLSQKSAAL